MHMHLLLGSMATTNRVSYTEPGKVGRCWSRAPLPISASVTPPTPPLGLRHHIQSNICPLLNPLASTFMYTSGDTALTP